MNGIKTIIIFVLILASYTFIAAAPIWYGSGDDTGLVGRWSCENNFKDSSGQGKSQNSQGEMKCAA